MSQKVILGTSGADTLTAHDAAGDILRGHGGADILISGPGNDTLDGGGGNDTASYVNATSGVEVYLTKEGAPQFTQGAGNDTLISIENLTGSQHGDTLSGGSAHAVLNGLGGDDFIVAGSAGDTLIGGLGYDQLVGGAGHDHFVYNAPSDSLPTHADRISNFGAGDRIDVSAIDADPATPGHQHFHLGATPGHVGDIVQIVNASAHSDVIEFFVDGDANPDMAIHLVANAALGAAFFIL